MWLELLTGAGQPPPPALKLTADSGPLSYVSLFAHFSSACPLKEGIPWLSVPLVNTWGL